MKIHRAPHFTTDLETMGVSPTSAIMSIGAVAFGGEQDHTFYVRVDLQSCLDHGLTVDGDTIYWWLDQSDAARRTLLINQLPLPEALAQYRYWVHKHTSRSAVCWTHATFDAPILSNAFRACGTSDPVHYRQHRDIRTLVDLTQDLGVSEAVHVGVPHHAQHDAERQATYISRMLRAWQVASQGEKGQ